MRVDSLLACLIHEEIIERHGRMGTEVNFLATFNVLYRRHVLEESGGFDERLRLAQDAELAYRVQEAGYRLRFEPRSIVAHFHPTSLRDYLRTQARQGYYRVHLYRRHPRRMMGDDYSGLVDYAQPVLSLLLVVSLVVLGITGPFLRAGRLLELMVALPICLAVALLATSLPLMLRIVARTRQARDLWFAPMAAARSLARATGLLRGVWELVVRPRRNQ